jgi:hypothetical protein
MYLSSVVIHYLYVFSARFRPAKADAPLIVGGANAGLLCQQSQGFANVCTNGTWRAWSIFDPPFSGLTYLRCGARGYLNAKRHR